jgi:hypothetical protein
MRYRDLSGKRFDRLTVIERIQNAKGERARWLCRCECGNQTKVLGASLTSGNTKSCGCLQRETATQQMTGKFGFEHPNWKGGRHKDSWGYIHVRIHGKYRLEHHVVMEEILGRTLFQDETVHHLGRTLFQDETVHHKNGRRDDNRPENLELWCSRHPSGQRIEDLCQWAQEILNRYATR